MNLTLRKANAVQTAINDAIKGIEIKTTVELNEFQGVEAELQKANTALFANDARRQRLLLALYNIRGLVGQANATSGVDTKLATAAFLDKRLAQLAELASVEVITDLAVITGKLDKIKNSKDDASRGRIYGYTDTVSTSVVSAEQLVTIKNEIKNLKKQKQKVNDEILELNIKTEIPLSEEVIGTLTSEGLV